MGVSSLRLSVGASRLETSVRAWSVRFDGEPVVVEPMRWRRDDRGARGTWRPTGARAARATSRLRARPRDALPDGTDGEKALPDASRREFVVVPIRRGSSRDRRVAEKRRVEILEPERVLRLLLGQRQVRGDPGTSAGSGANASAARPECQRGCPPPAGSESTVCTPRARLRRTGCRPMRLDEVVADRLRQPSGRRCCSRSIKTELGRCDATADDFR